ncbi:MAG: hypothetical protein EOO60_05790 [Hymenobacter sp.]|nr:MAG: hypothetical protein EOO60_05790 [Hymenobacter sp.]
MQVAPLFVPECHVDTALARSLVVYRQDFDDFINHKHGLPNVAKEMQRQWQLFGASRSVVGIVDRDKRLGDVVYLDEFTTLIGGSLAVEAPHSIRSHPARPNQYLIVLNPACDTWVWQAAVAAGVLLPTYSLPADRWDFITYCKQADVENRPELKMLLQAVSRARPAIYAELADFVAQVMDLTNLLP